MARIRPISNPNIPIPNNPFYSPESNYIQGVSGPFIVGSGLSINNVTGVISSSGGGGGAVSSIIAAAGISVTPGSGTGNVTVSNTGVLSITAGSGISVSAATGNITISSTSGATVSNVIGTAPISVANGTTTPNVSVATATTTNSGVTTLVNNLVTDDSTKALTAAQGKSLQDQINALAVSGTIELAGTVDAALGVVASVTSVGSADGYVVGSALPLPSSTTNNTYVIVTTPGTLTPPGGTPTAATRGDWFLVSETTPGNYQWTFLNVGFDAPSATDTVAGIVELATNAETQTGIDATRAVTPAGAAATYVPLSTLTAKGTLIAGQAANSPVALPVGTIGQVLQVDPTTTSGLKWVTPAAGCTGTVTQVGTGAALSGGPITTTGAIDLVVQGIAAGNYSNPSITVNCYGVITGISSGTSGIPCSCITAKGDLIAGASANNPVPLSVGTNGQVLVACSTTASGLCWLTVPATLPATPTVLGTVLGCTTATNTAIGCNALLVNTGPGNVAVGLCALASNTTSDRNTAVGDCALRLNTTGVNNIALGALSMFNNTTGGFNVSIGRNAMCSNTVGNRNVSVGNNSGCSITTGVENVAIGADALCSNTTYGQNTAVGAAALQNFNGGPIGTNDAFGALALCALTTGNYNVSLGGWSLFSFVNGCNNTAVGHRAMSGPTGGNNNTALGFYAGFNLTTGSNNVAIGCGVSVCNPSGNCQLAIGFAPGQNWLTGDSNKNIRPGNGIIDCIGSVGTAGQILKTTGTGALQWSSVGAMSSGFVNDVGTAGQWIEIDGIQFGMWTGCRSFVMRPTSGTMTASWGTCYQGGVVGFAATNFQDIAIASPNWRFIFLNANFPSHATVQQATICVAPSGGFTRAMYQFCGIVGASYLGNGISVTRIA
jgi:hypothetical protein